MDVAAVCGEGLIMFCLVSCSSGLTWENLFHHKSTVSEPLYKLIGQLINNIRLVLSLIFL